MTQDSTKSIWHTAKRFFSGTLLSRLTGMTRDITMAYAFGTQPAIAALMLAFRLAHALRRLLGEGALQTAFIPIFESLRHEDEARALGFFRDLQWVLAWTLIGLILAGEGILVSWLTWGNPSADVREVVYLSALMLPSLLFICLYGLNASLLQCQKHYFITSAAPVAFNIIWTVAAIALHNEDIIKAVPILAIAIVLACLGQWVVTLPSTWANLKSLKRHRCSLSPDLWRMVRPLGLGILGVSAVQLNNVVDALFARYAEVEGPAFLWYASRLQQLPLALFGIALASALLPPLARAFKTGDEERYRHFLQTALFSSTALMLPLTAAIFVIGDTGINLLYGHGDFTRHAIANTNFCLWAYGAGLIPTALIAVLAPACYAQGNYRLPTATALLNLVVNGILNAIFVLQFGWGAISVAIATSISAWLNLGVLGWQLSVPQNSLLTRVQVKQIFKIGGVTVLACLGTIMVRNVGEQIPWITLWSTEPAWSQSLTTQLTDFIWQSATFCGVFGLGSYCLQLWPKRLPAFPK